MNAHHVYTHEEITTAVIALISDESGEDAQLDSLLMDGLGLDSLDFVNIAQLLEETFNIPDIPDDDLFRLQTVGQIVNYIEAYCDRRARALAPRVAEA
jgi:acyl carrier protein